MIRHIKSNDFHWFSELIRIARVGGDLYTTTVYSRKYVNWRDKHKLMMFDGVAVKNEEDRILHVWDVHS